MGNDIIPKQEKLQIERFIAIEIEKYGKYILHETKKIQLPLAYVSCKNDYAVKNKKMTNPGVADVRKQVTFVNDYSGVGRMSIFITIPGVFDKRLIPRGTSTIEFIPVDYDMIMYCGLGDNGAATAIEKRTVKLSVPRHSRVEITWKFLENGYNFKLS